MHRSIAGLLLAAGSMGFGLVAAPAQAGPVQNLVEQLFGEARVELKFLGRYSTGLFDEGGAEIPAHDPLTQRVFVVNLHDRAIDVLNIRDPRNPSKIGAIDLSALGQAANSVDVHGGVLAVAVEAAVKTDPGLVALYDTRTLRLLKTFTVGALPDMLKFSPDGRYIVVANEGEPNAGYTVDPEGSVSIIEWRKARNAVRTASFAAFNTQAEALKAAGVRIFGPHASVAQDIEPEYIAIAPDNRKAYVTLQENNAIAIVDLASAVVEKILPLGSKNHLLPGNGLDPSDKDNAVAIGNWPVRGLYMPDSIALHRYRGQTYLLTANEGDARDYDTFKEEKRIKDLTLDPVAFPTASDLRKDPKLGRLNVTSTLGDANNDGKYEQLFSFGARSFSVWNVNGDQVYDSGDDFEQITQDASPAHFNADSTANDVDNRSDNKGPEPEGIAIGTVLGQTYAFIGLERVGGIMVYDISNPALPEFVQYLNTRNFNADPEEDLANAGDLGPEGLVFVDALKSPTLKPLLIVGNEISGTTAIYEVSPLFQQRK